MKRMIMLVLLISATLMGAMAQSSSDVRRADKKARQVKTAAMVDSLVAEGRFAFVASRAVSMLPSKPYIMLDGRDQFIVDKDKVTSQLPFYGRLYSAPTNASIGPLSFTSTDITYKILDNGNKKAQKTIKLDVRENNSTIPGASFVINIDIFGDASASLTVTMSSGSPSVYYGYIKAITD
ncbi:MAG: DUF4251 domain-containing protein [Mucinivorans sp.]